MNQAADRADTGKLTQLEGSDRTLGVDELNLAEFPICSLSTRTEPGQNTLLFEDEIFDESTGKRVQRSLVIAGSEHFGLPTSVESDVLLVLVHLSNVRSGFKERKVAFSRYELIKFLGWDLGGKSYERLDQSLRRWTSVTLHYKHAWWDRSGKKWRTRSFHVLESLELRGKDEFADDGLSSFMWNEVIFNSFQAGNLKRINLNVYFRLESAIARQIYRFADKRFYQRRVLAFPLRTFACEHIGLSRSYDNFDLKRKLQPALVELEGIGFLKPHPQEERFVKLSPSNWEIRLERAGAPTTKNEALSPLVAELTRRGVSKTTATSLTQSFAANHIEGKIALHDELLAKRDRRISRNPPGFLASAIRDNYQVANWSSQNAPPARAKNRPSKDRTTPAPVPTSIETERTVQLTKVRAYWSQLSDAEKQELESQAVASGNPFHVASYKRLKTTGSRLWESLRDELVAAYLSKQSFAL
jgi:plasmid replication initiation protein